MAGGARGQHAIHHVDAEAGVLDDLFRSSDSHQVPRFLFREERRRKPGDLADRVLRLPHRHPADRVTVEAEVDQGTGGASAQVFVRSSLHDPEEQSLSVPSMTRPLRPAEREPARFLDLAALRGKRRADVERHRDVDAEFGLELDCELGRQEMPRSILRRPELDPFVGQAAPRRKAHDLKAAGVGQDGATPSEERVQTSGAPDDRATRARHQVIRVREDRAAVPLFESVELDPLDGAPRAHGKEARRLDLAVRRRDDARPSGRIRIARENPQE